MKVCVKQNLLQKLEPYFFILKSAHWATYMNETSPDSCGCLPAKSQTAFITEGKTKCAFIGYKSEKGQF